MQRRPPQLLRAHLLVGQAELLALGARRLLVHHRALLHARAVADVVSGVGAVLLSMSLFVAVVAVVDGLTVVVVTVVVVACTRRITVDVTA